MAELPDIVFGNLERQINAKAKVKEMFEMLGEQTIYLLATASLVRRSVRMVALDDDAQHAIDVIKKALQDDAGYYIGWQANIAMSFVDSYRRLFGEDSMSLSELHRMANDAAKNFLDHFINE